MAEKPFRVMLATDYDPSLLDLSNGIFASPKLDGIRAYVRDGVVLSRKNKPIPNKHVQSLFKHMEHHDGELVVGAPFDEMCFRNTSSGVMAKDGEPDVHFHIFDHVLHQGMPYAARLENVKLGKLGKNASILQQTRIESLEALAEYEAKCLKLGYEGVIVRRIDGHYKQGRSTVREGLLLKVKSFLDDEALVVGFEERMANMNEATVSETGHTKRSSHKSGKVGRGDLGALIVEWKGMRFNIGTGFTDAERQRIWDQRKHYLGQLAKFRYFPVGGYEAPRHTSFVGFRDKIDM